MNFLRENEADFECSFDCNDNGELQSILTILFKSWGGGEKRGECSCGLVNNMSKQTSKKKTLSFGLYGELSHK